MSKFKDYLLQDRILIADGATGTQLLKVGLKAGVAPESWNLDNTEAIINLHRSYLDAGADIVLTNTFGGSRLRLERHQLQDRVYEINAAAARLARQAVGDHGFVFGDIGPSGSLLQPFGKVSYEEAVSAFKEQAEGLLANGVDAILIETMSDLNEAKAAVEGVRQVDKVVPILVTFSFDTHGRTMMGLTPVKAAESIWPLGVTAIGANCGRTLSETLTAIEQMRAAIPEAVLMAKPNAGLPHASDGNIVYDVTPEVMAEFAQRFAEQGVKVFGGCCGSTPEHIQAIAQVLK
jgi:5-methyltetrahydrofolate--homocysteine methyltransferase